MRKIMCTHAQMPRHMDRMSAIKKQQNGSKYLLLLLKTYQLATIANFTVEKKRSVVYSRVLLSTFCPMLRSKLRINRSQNSKDTIQNTKQYNAIKYNTIPNNTIQYNTKQYNTIHYNTIQYNTIQFNTIQYNTINTI